MSLLRKGLSFAITPQTVPMKEIYSFLASLAGTIYHLPRENQDATIERRFKDVRANCFCAFLLRTQIHMPRHASSVL